MAERESCPRNQSLVPPGFFRWQSSSHAPRSQFFALKAKRHSRARVLPPQPKPGFSRLFSLAVLFTCSPVAVLRTKGEAAEPITWTSQAAWPSASPAPAMTKGGVSEVYRRCTLPMLRIEPFSESKNKRQGFRKEMASTSQGDGKEMASSNKLFGLA